MILSSYINVKCTNLNIKKLRKIKKDVKVGQQINLPLNELSLKSNKKIKVRCDNCYEEKEISYYDYNKITNNGNKYYYCSKCKGISIKNTTKEKYGVNNVFQLKETKDKSRESIKRKYKTDHHLQNKEIFKKQKNTNKKKYGHDYPMQNKKIHQKQRETNKINYGVEYVFQNNDIKEKIKNTIKEKYGVDFIMQNEDIKEKVQQNKKNNIINKYKDYDIIDINKNVYKIKCNKGHIFEITSQLFRNRIKQKTKICTECNPINSYSISGLQKQLNEFIDSFGYFTRYNDNNVISPYELDIFIPDLDLAIEFNGVYWHNELNKSNHYHKLKSDLCEEKGIQLIHIWEDDWLYKQEIVKSILRNKLNINQRKIYARSCLLKEIKDNKIVKDFLEKNHIQGFTNSKVKIGLYYKDELVSIMTFGKSRKPLGKKRNNNDWEIIRYCNKLNVNILGGANKLFNYFLNNYNFNKLVSYVDRSYFNGNLYEKLGFEFKGKTNPNYYYVIEGLRRYRYNFRKDLLIKEGYDSNKTEHEIMLNRNIYRIYNAGNLKYLFS